MNDENQDSNSQNRSLKNYISSDNSSKRDSRRAFLKTVGTIGLFSVGAGSVRAEDTVEIVTVKRQNEIVETKKVNEEWFSQLEEARRAANKAKEKVRELPLKTATFVTNDGDVVGNRNGHQVTTLLESPNQKAHVQSVNPSLSEDINGINVETRRGLDVETTCYEQTYDPVKGGAAINLPGDDPDGNSFTAGGRVFMDSDGSERMLTCRHAFAPISSTTDVTGEDVEQWGDDFGTVSDHAPEHDAVLIKLDSSGDRSGISKYMVDLSNTWDLNAYYTKNSIAEGGPLSQRGVTTCDTQTEIQGHDGEMSFENGNAITDLVFTDTVSIPGDSGALKFGVHPTQGSSSAVAGALQTAVINDNYDVGAAAYAMNDSLNIDFGAYGIS